MVRIGLVGCGLRATKHLDWIVKQEGTQLVGVADIDEVKAKEKANKFGVKHVFISLSQMLKEQSPDVVHIVTPPISHAKLAIEAMDAGCHVFVEKPMALAVEEADAMLGAAKKHGVKLCVGHNYLLHPIILKIGKLLRTGKLGDILHVESYLLYDVRRNPDLSVDCDSKHHWAYDLSLGLLEDLAAHPVSLLLNFMEYPRTVFAVSKDSGDLPGGKPGELRALVDSKNMTGFLVVSTGIRPDSFSLNIYGSKMAIFADLWHMTLVGVKNRRVPGKLSKGLRNVEKSLQLVSNTVKNTIGIATGRVGLPNDVRPLVRAFYKSIDNKADPPVNPQHARDVVAFMNEIGMSCRQQDHQKQ